MLLSWIKGPGRLSLRRSEEAGVGVMGREEGGERSSPSTCSRHLCSGREGEEEGKTKGSAFFKITFKRIR